MRRRAEKIGVGTAHIIAADPVMRRLARTCPPLTALRLETNRFAALAQSILSQQISVHAARAIRARLLKLTEPEGLSPTNIQRLRPAQLRAAGISATKASYLKDLAVHVTSRRLELNRIGRSRDGNVIQQLTAVKGIGVWTAQMFLIFSLGRLDVFPHDDYGVRAALQRLYGLAELPDKKTSFEIAEPWAPYRTIASWYCWRSHELDRGKSGKREG